MINNGREEGLRKEIEQLRERSGARINYGHSPSGSEYLMRGAPTLPLDTLNSLGVDRNHSIYSIVPI